MRLPTTSRFLPSRRISTEPRKWAAGFCGFTGATVSDSVRRVGKVVAMLRVQRLACRKHEFTDYLLF